MWEKSVKKAGEKMHHMTCQGFPKKRHLGSVSVAQGKMVVFVDSSIAFAGFLCWFIPSPVIRFHLCCMTLRFTIFRDFVFAVPIHESLFRSDYPFQVISIKDVVLIRCRKQARDPCPRLADAAGPNYGQGPAGAGFTASCENGGSQPRPT